MLDHQISSYMITWSTSSVRKSCKSFVPRNKVLSFNSMIQSLPHPPPFITMAIGINLLINYFGMALRPNRWCECEPHTLMGLLRQKKPRPSCCTRPFSVQVHTLLTTGKIQLTICFCFLQLLHQQNAIFQSFRSIDKDGGLMPVLIVSFLESVHCSVIVDWGCFDRLYWSTCSFSVVILLFLIVTYTYGVILLNPCNR